MIARALDRVKTLIKKTIELSGYTVHKIQIEHYDQYDLRSVPEVYDQDGLRSAHNHEFMLDPFFRRAYARGVLASKADYHWEWRVHVGLWAAYSASKLKGDFVECGVNRGFLSSAIMEFLNWDSLNRTFYLMDTFCGLDERYMSDEEIKRGTLELNKGDFYTRSVESVRDNFSQWKNIRIIVGAIPETLCAVEAENVAYLHIDMNCTPPEVAAFNYFWERLVPGAFILFDDYAYRGHELQRVAMDSAAATKDLKILSLPTGQGLLIKPA